MHQHSSLVYVNSYAQNDKAYYPNVKMLQNYHITTLNLVGNHSHPKLSNRHYITFSKQIRSTTFRSRTIIRRI